MNVKKYEKNPVLTINDVKPSREDFKVDGVFNCGAIKKDDEYILLCRVAESFINADENIVRIPVVINKDGEDIIQEVTLDKRVDTGYDYSDSRSVWSIDKHTKKIVYLTSLSHFRIARSKDGFNFDIDQTPTIFPRALDEEWGMEDARITEIDNVYYINYTSVSRRGAATSLMTTKDFATFERKGIIFAPENKDVTIFPQKINGIYYAFNRPVPSAIGSPDMWLAKSQDLIHWGEQEYFYGVKDNSSWENGRIGGGAVPFLTEKGFIKIYHAADANNRYCLGAFLLDKDDPSKILGRTEMPILEPTEDYEIIGFFGNVVFTCGCIVEDGIVNIYYGAADDKIAVAQTSVEYLVEQCLCK